MPVKEEIVTGALMGTKMVLNELLAFIDLSEFPEGALFGRTKISWFTLCAGLSILFHSAS